LLIIVVFWQKTIFFLKPPVMALVRRWEWQADCFAVGLLGTSQSLAQALKRLAADNLANLEPHPLYVWFNLSHPPLGVRVARLEEMA
jgi:STE24 endopeptidase